MQKQPTQTPAALREGAREGGASLREAASLAYSPRPSPSSGGSAREGLLSEKPPPSYPPRPSPSSEGGPGEGLLLEKPPPRSSPTAVMLPSFPGRNRRGLDRGWREGERLRRDCISGQACPACRRRRVRESAANHRGCSRRGRRWTRPPVHASSQPSGLLAPACATSEPRESCTSASVSPCRST